MRSLSSFFSERSSWNEKRSADLAERTEPQQPNGCHADYLHSQSHTLASWPDPSGRQASGEPRAIVISASTRFLACAYGGRYCHKAVISPPRCTRATYPGIVAQGPSLAFGLFTPKMRLRLKGV